MALTSEDRAEIAAIVAAALGAGVAPATPAPVAASVAPAAITLDGSSKSRSGSVWNATPEQLALDQTDPERNELTPLARKATYDTLLYVPLFRKERARLEALGVAHSASGKQAGANYRARLDIEKARLAARDGISRSTMAPVISAESRRSSGTYSDPTANQAIANVDREAKRIAALEAELAQLRGTGGLVLSVPVAERKAASNHSLAAKRAGINGYEATIAKIVREASKTANPGGFVKAWHTDQLTRTEANPHYKTDKARSGRIVVLTNQAIEACSRLGVQVS